MKKRNWKTTLSGIAILVMTGMGIASNPKSALNENTIQTVTSGLIAVGLIAAADSKKEESK
jgi:hypothetical protein